MIRVIVEPYCQNCRYFKPYISDKGYTTFPEPWNCERGGK